MPTQHGLSPFVFWGQSSQTLFLRVSLRDVKGQPDVSVEQTRVRFSAHGVGAHGSNDYAFDLEVYQPIKPEGCKMKVTGSEVVLEIAKQTAGGMPWPRLAKDPQKLPWLKVDFDKLVDGDLSDDESDAQRQKKAQEEYMNKLTKDIVDLEKKAINEIKTSYLFGYNLFQFVGYLFVFAKIAYGLSTDPGYKSKAYDDIGFVICLCQFVAILEIVHPWVGLVKSAGVLAPFLQVAGRNFILFGLVWREAELQSRVVVTYLLLAWSAVELFRYPFYMLSSVGVEWKVVTWLRYTVWIPLYPAGALLETAVLLQSTFLFAKSGKYSWELPNSINLSFYFPWFLYVYLIAVLSAIVLLMRHMYHARQKKLYGLDYLRLKKRKLL